MQAYAALVGNEPNSLFQLEKLAGNILGVAASLVGLALFVMFAVGAFQLLTSGSNQENTQKARQTFTFAAMGAAAVILLWLIFLFIEEFTGIDVLTFGVCMIKNDPLCQIVTVP